MMRTCEICGEKHFAKGLCSKHYHQLPQVKERHKKYSQSPEAKAKKKEYSQRPEIKAKFKELSQSPEAKAKKKEYSQRPEVKEKIKQRMKKYNKKYFQIPRVKERRKQRMKKYRQLPEAKAKKKEYSQRPEVKRKMKTYRKEYRQRPGMEEKTKQRMKKYRQRPEVIQFRKDYMERLKVKERMKKWFSHYYKSQRKTNHNYAVKERLRTNLRKAFRKYSTTGKISTSKKYGINYKEIIEHLKPFPENLSAYHIDHIIPLSSFDFNNPEQIKEAFAPENHQWLTAEENMRKGSKINWKKE